MAKAETSAVEAKISLNSDDVEKLNKRAETAKKSVKSLSTTLNKIKGATKGLSKEFSGTSKLTKLIDSVKRIAVYRAIRTVIKNITQSIKEGTQNLYKFSTIAGTTFAKSLDKISTEANYLKNSFATAFEPIINYFAPIIESLGDKIASLFNKISEVTAAAFGEETYTKATKGLHKYNTELKRTVLGFDELNLLNGDTNSNYSSMFEVANVSEEAKAVGATWGEVATSVKDFLVEIYNTMNDFAPAIGIILALTGHFGAGLALLGAWAIGKYGEADIGDWGTVSTKVTGELQSIATAAGISGMELGVILTLTGNYATGLGMIIANASVTAAAVNWGEPAEKVRDSISKILEIGAGVSFAAGIALLLTSHFGLGASLLAMSVASVLGASALSMDGEGFKTAVTDMIAKVTGLGAGLMAVTGLAMMLSGNVPGGAALLAAAGVTLFAAELSDIKKNVSSAAEMIEIAPGYFVHSSELESKATAGAKSILNTLPLLNRTSTYADGGFPEDGLFFANHNEIVGKFANGKTAVANNNQIVEGISMANMGVENAVYAMANMVVKAINDKNTDIQLDGTSLSRKMYGLLKTEGTRRGTAIVER